MTTRPGPPLVLLAALTAFVPLSIDAYLPALPAIARGLAADSAQVQLSLSIFLLGLCLGMLAYGPLSDRYGRRPLLLGGIALYLAATLLCMFAGSIQQLLVGRFLQALGGAASAVLARAIVRDLFPLNQAARILSLMHMITMGATLLAPIVGGLLMVLQGWRAIFLVLCVLGGACLLCTLARLDETLLPERRSDSVLQAFRAYGHLLREPLALAYVGCNGLSLAGMFAFITASPFVYMDYFQVSPQVYSWLVGANIAGVIALTLLNARLVPRTGPRTMIAAGAASTLVASAGLLFCGMTGLGGLPAIVAFVVLYVGSTGLFGANCIATLMALYPGRAGAVAALAVAGQFALGALCSAWVGSLGDRTPAAMCQVMAATGLACVFFHAMARRLERKAGAQVVRE